MKRARRNAGSSRGCDKPGGRGEHLVITAAVLLFLLGGCGGQEKQQEPEIVLPEVILAEVDGRPITLTDYNASVGRVPDSLKSAVDPRRYLQALIDEELLVQEAQRRGLERSSGLARYLQQQQQLLSTQLLYQQEGIERYAMSEEKLRDYFARSPYSRRVRFSLLMVKTAEKVLPLLEELKAGADFEKLSMQRSEDSRILARGADMGYHRWGETMPPYEAITQKAFTMTLGEIAGPLQVADGYFLIKLTDIHPVAFEEERETIEPLVIREFLGRQLRDYYSRLRERYELEYKPVGFRTLVDAVAEGSASGTGHQKYKGASTEDPALQIASFEDGVLTLNQCLQFLRESGQKVSRDPEILRQQLDGQIARQVLVPLEIERQGLAHATPVQEGMARARRKFLVGQLQNLIASQTAPPETDLLSAYFEHNRERYRRPARVEVRRMLVPDRASGEEIVDRLQAGRDTLSLVDRFVPVTYGSEALEEDNPIGRALRAEEGSIHGPLSTKNGYVVLQVLHRHESRLPILEEIRDRVMADLEQGRTASLLQALVENLRTRHAKQIKIYRERLQGPGLSRSAEVGDGGN